MRLDITNLLYKPNYFQEKPITLLHFIMQEWSGQLYPLNKTAIGRMREIYTECQCNSNELIWQKTIVENKEVEIIACADCHNWSLIMSSKNEKNGLQEERKRECLCQEDVNPSGSAHSAVRDGIELSKKVRRVGIADAEGLLLIARERFQAVNEAIQQYQLKNMARYLYEVAKVRSSGYYRWLQIMSF